MTLPTKFKTPKNSAPRYSSQQGVVLLEAMIAIMLISFAILGLLGLEATMIKDTEGSKYRSEASYIAQKEIGNIWSNLGNTAAYQNFSQPVPQLPNGDITITASAVDPGNYRVVVTWNDPGINDPTKKHAYTMNTVVIGN